MPCAHQLQPYALMYTEGGVAERSVSIAEARARLLGLIELDRDHLKSFAARVRATFPGARPERAHDIAEHACRKYSGRVGRSAVAKALDPAAVHVAVAAHVRHLETDYDALLGSGLSRHEGRDRVAVRVHDVLRRWQAG